MNSPAALATHAGRPGARQLLAAAPGAVYLLVILCTLLAVWRPEFLSAANLTNVALQVAVLVIVALGMTLVILTEGIDLSLGRCSASPASSWGSRSSADTFPSRSPRRSPSASRSASRTGR
jgi:predicted ABC-type sugar transport system permease subunit